MILHLLISFIKHLRRNKTTESIFGVLFNVVQSCGQWKSDGDGK